jgi:transcriptional regulator with XRE-family HTH domain
MQTIGERLEEARKRKGISIREASEATKIRSEYLHKFESNSFDLNLPEIYVSGFLRNYAVFLKLNGDKLIADYRSLVPADGRTSRRESREIYGRVDLGPAARQSAAGAASAAEESDAAPAPAPTPARSSSFPASAGANAAPIDAGLLIKGGALLLAVILVVGIIFGIRAIFGGSSKPAAELKAVAQQTLTLTAMGPVDVQVREETDGPIVWRGHLEANESHSVAKRGKLFLTATAMENLQIDIGGKRIPNTYSGYFKVQIP